MTISSKELRAKFLKYFEKNQHHVKKSAPLIPQDDATLLFVNAGMVPFKNIFTQKQTTTFSRAASSQKCVRAGGKHNDLENVGQTARHHTFFEMLGNFSFGDYFKKEAIEFAWNFLTQELKIDKSKLSVSVFGGDKKTPPDLEAEKIWHEIIGLPKEKIKRCGRADNFWQMGDVGPCGPCSEIFYDRSDISIGFGSEDEDEKNIEIWNLVFMQYEAKKDGTLQPLPAPCVDTGMGLERLTCVINSLQSNYDTDLLKPLIETTERLSKKSYGGTDNKDDTSMRVIADHARSTAFLISDGLLPGNEGRGYVLRRIMRRAIRHGAQLGLKNNFFHTVCLKVVDILKEIYPELYEARALLEKVVSNEETLFRKTLERGLGLFSQQTINLAPNETLDGKTVFKLYETYGFPPDLTKVLAEEKKLNIDWEEFNKAKQNHEERSSKGLGLKATSEIYVSLQDRLGASEFINQEQLSSMKVLALESEGREIEQGLQGQILNIIFDQTNFYGESGGQIGDSGIIYSEHFKALVLDTKKYQGMHIHNVKIKEGVIKKGDMVSGAVDWQRRKKIMRNHSATHLLHSALRSVLGTHVVQKGSLVAEDRLRFDFSHFEAMKKEEIKKVEHLVNEWILLNEEAKVQTMSMDEAKAYGALALFGEKYESLVRVLDMGSHSIELCGGTHCSRTGDIGAFRIVSEGPLAQGIRRLEAITGDAVVTKSRECEQRLKDITKALGVKDTDALERIQQILRQNKKLEKKLTSSNNDSLKDLTNNAIKSAKTIHGFHFIGEDVSKKINADQLRTYADLLRDKIGSGVVALGLALEKEKCILLVAATKDLAKSVHAGKIVAKIAPMIGGKGGGRPDFAQAGGSKSENLELAIAECQKLISA